VTLSAALALSLAATTPTTFPRSSTKAPPELPGYTGTLIGVQAFYTHIKSQAKVLINVPSFAITCWLFANVEYPGNLKFHFYKDTMKVNTTEIDHILVLLTYYFKKDSFTRKEVNEY
jgi:hypothetical protein